MKKLIFGFDVDLVIAPSDRGWIEWLIDIYGEEPDWDGLKRVDGKFDYNASAYFPDFKEITGVDPMSYWNEPYLYDRMQPIVLSVPLIHDIIKAGHDVIFISHTKGDHMSSKVRFLKRYFRSVQFDSSNNSGYIATKEKHLVKVDVMLDDRAINLNRFGDEVIKIYIDTNYYDPDFDKSRVDFISEKSEWSRFKSIRKFLETLGIFGED